MCWCRTGIISYPFSAALTSNPALPAGPFLIADLKLSHLCHTFICVNMEETSHILHNMYYIIILSLILTPLQNSPKKVIWWAFRDPQWARESGEYGLVQFFYTVLFTRSISHYDMCAPQKFEIHQAGIRTSCLLMQLNGSQTANWFFCFDLKIYTEYTSSDHILIRGRRCCRKSRSAETILMMFGKL